MSGDAVNFFVELDDITKEDFPEVKRMMMEMFGKEEETRILCEITEGFGSDQISNLLFIVFDHKEKIRFTTDLIIATTGKKNAT